MAECLRILAEIDGLGSDFGCYGYSIYDIHVNISYPWPIHTMEGYRYLGYQEGDLPVTESAAREIFSIPMYPSLSDEEQRQVSNALHQILTEIGGRA